MNGEYRNTVDEKGRLMIPPKLREQLGTSTELMLTKSPSDSLWLFTKEEFDKVSAAVNYGPLAMFNEASRVIDLTVISPARDAELDKSGRLMIPQVFRDYAMVEPKEECVIIGSMNHIEIISAKAHQKMMEEYRSKVSKAGNELSLLRMDK